MKRKVFFFEFWNTTPHLETALELAKLHVDAGDEVHFFFGGHDVAYKEGLTYGEDHRLIKYHLMQLPERRGASLIHSANFHFYPHIQLASVIWEPPKEKWSIDSLRKYHYHHYKAGLSALSSLISDLKSSELDFDGLHESINSIIFSGIQVYETVCQILKNECPDLVYVFNGRFSSCRAVMDAAEACNIPFLIHERGADKDRYYLQTYMPHFIQERQKEMLALWEAEGQSEKAKAIAHQFFTDRRKGKDQGWRSYNRQQNQGMLPDIDKSRKLVTYFSSSDDEYLAVGDIHQWKNWEDQFAAVQCLVSVCNRHPEIQLVMRLHPHLAQKAQVDRQRWMDFSKYLNVTVIPPDSKVDTYALIEASDIVVCALSTVGIESVYWGVPAINLGSSAYDALEATYKPTSESELEVLLTGKVLEAKQEKTLPFGYYYSVFGRPFVYYQPDTLFSGHFLGVNLQSPSLFARWVMGAWRMLGNIRKK